jgi:hypothetical protein
VVLSNLTPQKLPRQDTQPSSCHKGTIWLPIEHGFKKDLQTVVPPICMAKYGKKTSAID